MASTIRIKRSSVSGNPAVLAAGELAYSALPDNGTNGGDRLYIGIGTETGGNAASHLVIGGKYFTDKLSGTPGILTANAAVIVDSNSKINNFNVGNITITGSTNTVSSTDPNGNIILDPNGTGYVQVVGTNGFVLPVGTTAQQGPSVQGAIRYNSDTSQFEGYNGTTWTSMGGVRSVDGKAYIIAETSPGAGDDTIHFYSGSDGISAEVGTFDKTKFRILNTTQSTSTSTGALVVDGGVGIAKNLYVGGNLVVNGTTSSVNSTTVTVSDKNLELGTISTPSATTTWASGGTSGTNTFDVTSATGIAAGQIVSGTGVPANTFVISSYVSGTTITLVNSLGAPQNLTVNASGTYTFTNPQTDAYADGGGITLKGTTDKTFNWYTATNSWTSSENMNLVANKGYYIDGVLVLSKTALGSTVTTVGTITTGTWNAGIIGTAYGGTGYSSYGIYDLLVGNVSGGLSKLPIGTAGKILQVNSAGNALVYDDIDGGTY
jgi:hypothetical protein